MSHFVTKCMSNTLSNMTILLQKIHSSTNLCPQCVVVPGEIYHIYQCTHNGSRGVCTASVYALRKWLETRKMDLDISTIFVNALLYIAG